VVARGVGSAACEGYVSFGDANSSEIEQFVPRILEARSLRDSPLAVGPSSRRASGIDKPSRILTRSARHVGDFVIIMLQRVEALDVAIR
jgi:hypothetical protein